MGDGLSLACLAVDLLPRFSIILVINPVLSPKEGEALGALMSGLRNLSYCSIGNMPSSSKDQSIL